MGRKNIRCISVYIPHAGYPWTEFGKCFDEIVVEAAEAVREGHQLIIGGDFNLSLHVGDRGEWIRDLCAQLNLQVAGGMHSLVDASHWTFRSSLDALRRIDFILLGPGLEVQSTRASNDIYLGSDHRCIAACLKYAWPTENFQCRRQLMKEW